MPTTVPAGSATTFTLANGQYVVLNTNPGTEGLITVKPASGGGSIQDTQTASRFGPPHLLNRQYGPYAMPVTMTISDMKGGDLTYDTFGGSAAVALTPQDVAAAQSISQLRGPRVVLVGASISAANVYASLALAGVNHGTAAWLYHALVAANVEASFATTMDVPSGVVKSYDVAVSGQTSAEILATQVAPALAFKPNVVVVEGGGNDDASVSYADCLANDIALENAFLALNIATIRLPITPRTLAVFPLSDARRKRALWLAEQARRRALKTSNLFYVDWRAGMVDLATANGEPKAGYTYDGRHLTALGAFAGSIPLVSLLQKLLPQRGRTIITPDDAFDATANEYGNVLVNPFFTGTGGNLSTGCTGTLPDSWRAIRGGGAATAVCSIVPRTDENGAYGSWVQMAITPSGTGVSDFYLRQFIAASTTVPHPFSVGNFAQMLGDFEIDAGYDSIAFVTPYFRIDGTPAITYRAQQGTTDWGYYPVKALKGTHVTPTATVHAAGTMEVGFRVSIMNGGTGGPATVRFAAPALRKVLNPFA